MPSSIEFTLEGKRVDPVKKEDILRVAKRIQSIIYGDDSVRSPPEIIEGDGRVYFPFSNDYWLHPPWNNNDQKDGSWRLDSRYAEKDDLKLVIQVLKRFL